MEYKTKWNFLKLLIHQNLIEASLKSKKYFFEIVSIIISAISVLFALWANIKATESNQISKEAINISVTANALAKEGNDFLSKDSNPHPRIVNGPEFSNALVLSCKTDDVNEPYSVIVAATPGFEIENYGVQSIWLQDIVWDAENLDWEIGIHENGSLVPKNYDFLPDTHVRWNIVAIHQKTFSLEQEAIDYLQNLPSYVNVNVKLLFEDDQEKTWPFVVTIFRSENIQDFSTPCREHLLFFATQY